MKSFHLAGLIATSGILLATASQANLIPLISRTNIQESPKKNPASALPAPGINQQQPIMSNNDRPVDPFNADPTPNSNILIADILASQKAISIFAGFTRDISSLTSRLNSDSTNSTLLAPVNSAISALPRKPWEDPQEYSALGSNAYEGQEGSERAEANLRRFVEAHIVGQSPWAEGEKLKTLGGREVWWERRKDAMIVMPGEVEVEKVAKKVGNGEVWVLKEVLDYARK
ncbi:FAS1 domain-containing [Acrodontium crateriforme]|uniref:FAS1 domain-containing n=1 Tax=Acrodontium crateriforme TaxID=150365 RepID=A0AAQ3M7F7_9PEZI|nr:FAS1 domain-containing [Acrodontium crateriforme]